MSFKYFFMNLREILRKFFETTLRPKVNRYINEHPLLARITAFTVAVITPEGVGERRQQQQNHHTGHAPLRRLGPIRLHMRQRFQRMQRRSAPYTIEYLKHWRIQRRGGSYEEALYEGLLHFLFIFILNHVLNYFHNHLPSHNSIFDPTTDLIPPMSHPKTTRTDPSSPSLVQVLILILIDFFISDGASKKATAIIKGRIISKLILDTHENIWTVPNILTFSRLLAAPGIGALIVYNQPVWAVSLLVYACFTDLVDGFIARKWNMQSVAGTVMDPVADKVLMTTLTVCLGVQGSLPLWLMGLIIGRDACMAIAAIPIRYMSLPPPKTMTRYWDMSIPSAEVHPTWISKLNTALQMGLLVITTALPIINGWDLGSFDVGGAMIVLQYVVGTTTVLSGVDYAMSKDAVKFLTPEEVEKRQKERKV
ncbi:MAG: cardiolipin synthase [Cirrosporium novae-zelandiae]|nr:MAG: cardiolipin synthase [Cirrosporium novae-zelandiae]